MKFKADWIAFGNGLENDNHTLVAKIGDGIQFSSDGKIIPDLSVVRNNTPTQISAKHQYIVYPELPDTPPPNDLVPVTKKFVESRLNGLVWRWPVFCAEQFDSEPTGGIRSACRIAVVNSADILSGTYIYCSFITPDGIKRYFNILITDSPASASDIDISDSPDEDTFATRIITAIKAIAAAGNQNAAYLANYSTTYGDRAYFIYNYATVISDFKIWVTDSIERCFKITLPIHDNIGRPFTELINNETHFAEENDTAYTWDNDSDTWIIISGVGSIPFATKDLAGKVRPLDGLSVSAGDIAVALSDVSGLSLAGISPNQTLEVADSLAGIGLSISSKVLNVNTGFGLDIDSNNNIEVVTDDIIDTTKGLDISATGQIQINALANGGLLFDSTTGAIYVDPASSETKTQYIVQLDTLTFAQGYIILPSIPDNLLTVDAYVANGLRFINQNALEAAGISSVLPDFALCPLDGYTDHFVFANNVTIGTWTSAGLSDIITSGDILFIVYEVK